MKKGKRASENFTFTGFRPFTRDDFKIHSFKEVIFAVVISIVLLVIWQVLLIGSYHLSISIFLVIGITISFYLGFIGRRIFDTICCHEEDLEIND